MSVVKLLCIGLIFSGFITCGQEKSVPLNIKAAFSKKFPDIKVIAWEKESETEWEAEFKMNGIKYSAVFIKNGAWKETEHEIDKKDIQKNIKNALEKTFPKYTIDEVEMVETKNGNVYEMEIEKGDTEMKIVMNNDGEILKKEIEKDDD